jgi:LemA protein
MSVGIIVFVAVAAIAALWAVGIFNRLVSLKNQFKNAFAQIDVQLKRRYDLIPNLVETAKGYLAHERGTLEAVISARNSAHAALQTASQAPDQPGAVQALSGADAGLTAALGRLMVLKEAYPDLKANQTMAQLSEELTSTENKVSFARQSYNDAVMIYNTSREQFPNSFIAGFGSFPPAELFEIENATERQAPKVSFS